MLKTGGLHPISKRQGPIAPGCSKCSGKWPSKCINLHQDASYHWENMEKLTLMMMMMKMKMKMNMKMKVRHLL